ncbi:MAG TPA: 23S rRNA (adenine(2503)-C(2))-methyltransferase RlmN [Terriglobia bacterium]|nr:23S rRNA (adenine(2503)-C(2))-methyltransferase RlmN [Terriglobia bacterium]
MTSHKRQNLVGMTREELEQFALDSGQPRYRGGQLYEAIYHRRARDFALLTNLSRGFREFLSARSVLAYPTIERKFVSRDGSVRYLLGLDDANTIEAVYMPEENRATLCISSQVGCAVDCRFCFTALVGVRRNLTAGEIVGQVLALADAEHLAPKLRLNVVLMGQGEPLLNLGPVMKAVRILADPAGCGVALRRITLSTSGIVPRIADLGREPVRPKLAISLNASTEEQRTALMPINRKYPLRDLLQACRDYPLRPRERITFEYVMLDAINDSQTDAGRVAELLRDIRSRVNLIPYNPGDALPYRPSPLARVLKFQEALAARHVPAFIRISRGRDIMAACGQLSLVDIAQPVEGSRRPVAAP